jgi:hypothetical protein
VAEAAAAAVAAVAAAVDFACVKPYSTGWYAVRRKVYDAVKAHFEENGFGATVDAIRDRHTAEARDLLERMIDPAAAA